MVVPGNNYNQKTRTTSMEYVWFKLVQNMTIVVEEKVDILMISISYADWSITPWNIDAVVAFAFEQSLKNIP